MNNKPAMINTQIRLAMVRKQEYPIPLNNYKTDILVITVHYIKFTKQYPLCQKLDIKKYFNNTFVKLVQGKIKN